MADTDSVFVVSAASGVHVGNCFLGAFRERGVARRAAGRRGHVHQFDSVEEAVEKFPHWEEEIYCDL